jgi:thioester reductase-like protein
MLLNKTIFLTGFPGFIASRLVRRLAKERARFLLLVQPSFITRAKEEIDRISNLDGIPIDHFQLVEGDITLPNLGLKGQDLERVCKETSIIFHLAALYDLAVPRDKGMLVNLTGTQNINNLALKIKNLECYHYISTCYVAGKRKGRILEAELEHTAGFRNYYEESKYLAELEVEKLKNELPIIIHRPSVVCGDSKTGETAKYDGIYYLILYLRMAPKLLSLFNIGNHQVRLNIVPVDFVVEAMAVLANDKASIGSTLQLADPDPLTTHQLFETIAQALSKRGSLITIPPKLVQSSLTLPFSPHITGLPSIAVPYFFINQTYDTNNSQRLLSKYEVTCPPFPTYIDPLLNFVDQHPKTLDI